LAGGVIRADHHPCLGEVPEQSACDDLGMDKIVVPVGLLYPYNQKAPPRRLRKRRTRFCCLCAT